MKANRSMIGAAALALGLAVTIQGACPDGRGEGPRRPGVGPQKIMLQYRGFRQAPPTASAGHRPCAGCAPSAG